MRLPRPPRTVVRFACVGVLNTLIDLWLFWLLQPPLGILTANVVSTSAGMAFSFVVNGRHTFGATRVTGQQVLAFVVTNGFTLWLLQPLAIGVAHGPLGVPLLQAKVCALGTSVVTNFLLYRYVVWAPGPVTPSPRPAGRAAAPEAARR